MSHFEKRVQLNKIIESQLPEFLVADFPKAVEFFKQYYISLENQGSSVDLVDNLDRYIKIDNLIPEVVVGKTLLSSSIDSTDTTITVLSTKGFPDDYGLLKIDDEIITYTSKTDTTFLGCIRGFSGITGYDDTTKAYFTNTNRQSVIFEDTVAASHTADSSVQNLSALFLQEFYKKLKTTFTPGFEDRDFVDDLDVGNFVKHARDFYQSKGIEESIIILFKVLYGVTATVIDLEERLLKPSSANYIRRETAVVESISGNPSELKGQTIFKSNDLSTSASVSEVEVFTRNERTFYKLGLFVGYDDRDLIEGFFSVPGYSRSLEPVFIGDTVISVDSTIGFPESGTLISGQNKITYTSKSINQFFGCSGINVSVNVAAGHTEAIMLGGPVRADETVFGYGNGDINNRIDLRLTGVLSDFVSLEDIPLMEDEETLLIENIGEVIDNPDVDKTYKQVFANSWKYNTSARFDVKDIQASVFVLYDDIDKSQLKKGDVVDILLGSSNYAAVGIGSTSGEVIVHTDAIVDSVNTSTKEVTLSNLNQFTPDINRTYSIRRKLFKARSIATSLKDGNNTYISDTLNVYTTDNEQFGYAASYSLPSYEINDEIVESTIPNGTKTYLEGYDNFFKNYSTIVFSEPVKFIDGDQVLYTATNQLSGLVSGEKYTVKVIDINKIKLFATSILVATNDFVRFTENLNPGSHTFTLERHEDRVISPKNILRKFQLSNSTSVGKSEERNLGNIGMMVDGVEISSPQSTDNIFFGPISSFEVLNGGDGYDILNPPNVTISAGAGSTAYVEPVVQGIVKSVLGDPQDFDVDEVLSVTLTGMNGEGCELKPIMGSRFREIEFDSRQLSLGGGIDIGNETITFREAHNLDEGQIIIYNQNGNNPLAVGDPGDPTNTSTGSLASGDEYAVKIINPTTIKLHATTGDALAGINTIGLTETSNGIHIFRTKKRNNLREVKVINSGSGFTYRKLRVKPKDISIEYDSIIFNNHGFESGEIVEYSFTGTGIGGLDVLRKYSIDKISSDRFRLIDLGQDGSLTTDLVRGKYVNLTSVGAGYHIFQYPQLSIVDNSTFTGGVQKTFQFTPIIEGKIIDAYLYESGTGYGSTTLNLHKKPVISISKGKNAQLAPIISNGKIKAVQVLSRGNDYVTPPELVIEDTSIPGGTGAIIRPVMVDNKVDSVVVINEGLGYNPNTTSIYVKERGFGSKFGVRIRNLQVNDAERFAAHARNRQTKIFSSFSKNKSDDSLVYGIYGYSEDLAKGYFENIDGNHSPIIGWAYDGNPIYGPYGYADPEDIQSGVRILTSSYKLNTGIVSDRPSSFASGFFIDDYKYDASGDLDIHNGRFCKTPEFPNGIYAYFATVGISQQSPKFEPQYPYFIGETYKSKVIEENFTLDHTFDFNNSTLSRNTLPYNINKKYANYDFINEGYESFVQQSRVKSITKGNIDEIRIIQGGEGYKLNDRVNFDLEGTGGVGLRAEVSELVGAAITSINTTLDRYEGVVFEWKNDKEVIAFNRSGFEFINNDNVLVGGLSTSITSLPGIKNIGFSTETVELSGEVSSYSALSFGKSEDIFVSRRFNNVSAGSSVEIISSNGTEIVTVLNDFGNGVLKIHRHGAAGVAHTATSTLNLKNNSVILKAKTKKFSSERNSLAYFNANNSIGVGVGTGSVYTFEVGGTPKTVAIPPRQIYIPNHPFKTGQKLTFTKSFDPTVTSIIVGDDNTQTNTFSIPDTVTRTSDVYVINKGRDYIGLTTTVGLTTTGNGLYFYSNGSDNSQYLLETNKEQITGEINKVVTTVSCGTTHGLSESDEIKMTVIPNTIVGIGTTAAVTLKFNEDEQKILINPNTIPASSINTVDNIITIEDHGFETGDKIYYESSQPATGLSVGSYFVIKNSSSEFRLAETKYETFSETEKEVNITNAGTASHTFSLVNPPIDVVRNGDLQFILSDSSLQGYRLKIFREKEFINEFNSSYDTRDPNVKTSGIIGVNTSSLTISYSENIPSNLFYTLEKGSYISTSDTDVENACKINYIDSEYNGSYNIFGVDNRTFKFSPFKMPKVFDYINTQCDKLEYSIKSSKNKDLDGTISKVEILSKGFKFESLPKFINVSSGSTSNSNEENGVNANLVAISTSIGRIKKVRFVDIGYDYPSDKTLRPDAFVPPIVRLDNLDTIDKIDIEYGGARYLSDPDLILWNETKQSVYDSTSLVASAPNGAVSSVEQLGPLFGLDSEPHRIIAINNSNGVGISSMTTSAAGIATCTLSTPLLGFTNAPFETGDFVFTEGIQMATSGDGYNSADYGYKFFKIISYQNTSPAKLTFKLADEDDVMLTSNPGIAKTIQSGYATIVNKKNYPIINVVQKRSSFSIGEKLFVDAGTGFTDTDLTISLVRDDYIKVLGRYILRKGFRIKGQISGSIAEVVEIDKKRAKFTIDYASRTDNGWSDDIGMISEDFQVTPDNDYYQNLSYSIKSPITWKDLSGPVNSILHPAGLKNFADVGISSVGSFKAGLGATTTSLVVLDVLSEERVDAINNFDNAVDDGPIQSRIGNFLQSNTLQIQNRKLTDYTECRTNRVLFHDDISSKFSSAGFKDLFSEIEEVSQLDNHIRYTIQIIDPDTSDVQLSEVVLLSTKTDTYLFEKYSAFTNERLGFFKSDIDTDGRKTFIFEPTDPYDRDHDIKLVKKSYLYQDLPTGDSGVGKTSFGSVEFTGSFVSGISSVGPYDPQLVGSGTTSIKTIASFDASNFNGAFASIEISDRFDKVPDQYVEAFVDFDGTNTYLSEYYFDTVTQSYSASSTGIISANYDASAGIVSIRARNVAITSEGPVFDVRSNIIGFAATTAGIGTYRFLLNNQPPGNERSARYESTVGFGTTAISLGRFDINNVSSSNSIVRVSSGNTSSIHQVALMANNLELESYVVPGPFTITNGNIGLGTFGTNIIGNEFFLNFYPDPGYNVEAQSMNEVLYRASDFDNQALDLEYGPVNQRVFLSAYDGLNGVRANRTRFNLLHEGSPIYMKTFDPADTNVLNYETGVFSYPNHFFNTGEELIYTPKSTFIGVGQTAIGIGETSNHAGIVTSKLPDKVFAIALTPDTFQLSTREDYARSGIFVTFTDPGEGNAHELEFTKKLSKTVISLDGIVQQPISFTPINHILRHNNGGITAGISTFNLSGISSIQPRDLLRIDDEYMKVVEVGLSTNVNGQIMGPINGIIASGAAATHPTVSVQRGVVGSVAATHTDESEVRIYRGSINIVKNEVFFAEPPKGNSRKRRNESNLPYVRAEYSGRTFLRSDYSSNMLFDDISDSFTGIAKTYTTTVGGINTVGIEPGNGIVFINGVFQTPSTPNNAGNNYIFENDSTNGVSSIVFTGITSISGEPVESEFDINQNQIPRGCLVVSFGSTPGLGYAPLVGANVFAKKNSSGELTEIVGINTWVNAVNVQTADYNNISGLIEIQTTSNHYLKGGSKVKLDGLVFQCDTGSGPTSKVYPDKDLTFDIFNIVDSRNLVVNVGVSTIVHTYLSGGEVYEHFSLNTGSGYREPVSIGVTDLAFEHRFVRAVENSITASSGGPFTATDAVFISHSGELRLTIPNHGLTTSDTILISDESIVFRCSDDDFFTEQEYPRSSDPASGANLAITEVAGDIIIVNVGPAGGAGKGAVVSATVGAGGTLTFSIDSPGTGYVNPVIEIPEPNYENMPVVGVSRLGIGSTTTTGSNLLVNLTMGQIDDGSNGYRFFDAANLITSNLEFIADIAYGRMLAQFPSYTPPSGTTGRDCKDDIVDVLESISYNLKYGGNDLTVDAANLYVTGAHVSGEEQETIYAFMEARDMAIQAMRNEAITVGGYSTRTQIFDLSITVDTSTPLCANVASAIHTLVGIVTNAVDPNIGTTPTRSVAPGSMVGVSDFKIARNGYGFQVGDIVTVAGLVTAANISEPVSEFQLEITQTFNDFFTSWSFGEMDYIDSILGYQDGNRTRFPLFYEGELLAFEIDPDDPLSGAIDLDSVLIIFINGVLQKPKYAYTFEGGTTFEFSRPPRVNDKVDIFFYVGTQGVDISIVSVTETLKIGDDVLVSKHPSHAETSSQLVGRTIAEILGSDKLETAIYTGPGINENTFKPIKWTKQKRDKYVKGDLVYKTRDSIEPKIFPTAKVISDVKTSSSEIFVDNAQFFDYDEIIYDLNVGTFNFDSLLIDPSEPVSAGFTAVVGAAGTISDIQITNSGFGYTGSTVDIKLSSPVSIGVGVGTTATAIGVVGPNGDITSVSITNPGFGYTTSIPAYAIAEVPQIQTELITNVQNVQGFSGIITGIQETTGSGGQKAIQFFFNALKDYGIDGEAQNASDTNDLLAGYPVMIYDTAVGTGVTSVTGNSDDNIVGIGTQFLNNIYVVDSRTNGLSIAANGEIICNVQSNTDLTGISSTGLFNDTDAGLTSALGRISWGRIYNYTERSDNPISIGVTGLTVDSGLSTFPTIQRRGTFGQSKSGGVRSVKPVSDPDIFADNNLPFYTQ